MLPPSSTGRRCAPRSRCSGSRSRRARAEREEGQRHGGAGADDRVDLVLAQDAAARRAGCAATLTGSRPPTKGTKSTSSPSSSERLCGGVEGGPAEGPIDAREPPVQAVQLLQVAAGGGDEEGRHGQPSDVVERAPACAADVARAGGAEDDRLDVRLRADPLDRLRAAGSRPRRRPTSRSPGTRARAAPSRRPRRRRTCGSRSC